MSDAFTRTTLGIMAGGGNLPVAVADAALAEKRPVFVVGVRGAAGRSIERFAHDWVKVGEFGRLVSLLKQHDCRDIVIIGSIQRPEIGDVRFDLGGLKSLPYFVRLALGGDDHLLSGIVRYMEQRGFTVKGAGEVAPSLLAPKGALTHKRPNETEQEDIGLGLEIIGALGPFDVGQAVVLGEKRVLAIEGAEGTDAMLDRCKRIKRWVDGSRRKRTGVLVKAPKPKQDRRVDLPTVGPETVRRAVSAGLAGIALVAGEVLIADRAEMLTLADEAGLFVFGATPGAGNG